jgi:HSP20 family protein
MDQLEKVGSMSALTRRGSRGLVEDLFELLEPPYALHHPLGGQAMRIEERIQNGYYELRAEMPGIDPEKQAKITVAKGVLTIQAERPEDEDTGHSEFRYGSFCRKVTLPENADEARIQAGYNNGILEISVALKPDQTDHQGRSIPIRMNHHIDFT